MKLNFKSIILALAAFGAASCVPSSIEELTGKYTAPVDVELTTLKDVDIVKCDGYRTISVALEGASNTLDIQFLVNTYYLKATTYTAAPTASAKSGNYNSDASTFNGKNFTGSVVVANTSAEDYTISGVILTNDNQRVRLNWAGKLTFEPDPEPVKLTQVFNAQSNVANGTNSVTLSLASANVTATYDAATYSTVYGGDGFFAAIDIYSADGYLHEGTYKASAAGGAINEGEFGIGWDPGDLWGIGMVFTNWGTCWWTVEGGQTSAQHINSGEVVVTKKGSKFVIEYNNYYTNGIWFVFEGAIEAVTEPAKEDVEVTWYKMVATNGGGSSVTDESGAAVAGFDRWDVQLLDGETVVAAFDLVVTEGSDIDGEYTVAGYPHADHIAGNGWGIAAWNYYGGSRVASGTDWLYIAPGSTFTVTKTAEGAYTFISDNITFQNSADGTETTGSIALGGTTGDVPAGPTVYELVATNGGGSSVTDESGAAVAGFDRWDVQLKDGETVVAAFDLVLTAGTEDFTGDFTVAGYPHADHVAGNGWGIAAWNYFGGSRFAQGTDWIYVNPGSEITITKNAEGVYTFKSKGASLICSAEGSEAYTGDFEFKGKAN